MGADMAYDYAVIRVVPRVDRGEFINVGVLLSCPEANFLDACVVLDEARLRALHPQVDVEAVRAHLAVIPRVCRGDSDGGPIGQLPARQRFHWLVAPRSTMIQLSPAHPGRTTNPRATLEHLVRCLVSPA